MSSKADDSAESNAAVSRCMEAWRQAFDSSLEDDEDEDEAREAADAAYRDAMPALFGVRNIRNFIACVTRGCLIGAIPGEDSSRLLYAAQVAYTTRRVRPSRPKNQNSPAKNGRSRAISTATKAIQEPCSTPVQPV